MKNYEEFMSKMGQYTDYLIDYTNLVKYHEYEYPPSIMYVVGRRVMARLRFCDDLVRELKSNKEAQKYLAGFKVYYEYVMEHPEFRP